MKMSRNCIKVAILVAAAWFTLATPARAQIASYVDEHGKLIFVNGDSPRPHRGSTISSHPANATGALIPSAQSVATPPDRLDRIVRDAAERHNMDPALVKAVISTESGWNPQAVSRKGAVGLMQLIPETAQRFGVGNPYDPAQNVEAGTTYLKALLDRYNGDLNKSLAAYNAGEHAVDRSGGVPAFRETWQYVQRVTDAYFQPGSGRNLSLWSAPKAHVRRATDSSGRVVFTNE
ncbi:MAG: lytic transglycosylase domain-containing protein [Candidatus Acidiferrales bacterium]